jgi:hypothetical protein
MEDYKKGKKIISDNRNEELLINLSLYKQQIGSNSSNEQTKLSLKSAYLGKIKSINDEYESRLITLKDKMSYDFYKKGCLVRVLIYTMDRTDSEEPFLT